ncbi:PAS domain S-box protein [bacterium]|nr:PAS domain S-box protein [bacterium]
MFKKETKNFIVLILISLMAILLSIAIISVNFSHSLSSLFVFTYDYEIPEFIVFAFFVLLLMLLLIFFRRTMHSSKELREILDLTSFLSSDVFVLADHKGKIEFISKSIEKTLKYESKYFIKKPVEDLFVIDKELDFSEYIKKTESVNFSIEYCKTKRSDGSTIILEIYHAQTDALGRHIYLLKDITDRIEAEKEISLYQNKLRALWSHLSLAEERERQRISADIHDEIGQFLALAKIKLGVLASSENDENVKSKIKIIRNLINQSIIHSKSLMFEYNRPIISMLGISGAISSICAKYRNSHDFFCTFEDDGKIKPLSNELSMILYQSTRELLMNIKKHADAERATVKFYRDKDLAILEVEDDGIGFELKENKFSKINTKEFGLFSISERIKYYSGNITIDTKKGEGTRVKISVPIKKVEEL